jgi:hypothetical protein
LLVARRPHSSFNLAAELFGGELPGSRNARTRFSIEPLFEPALKAEAEGCVPRLLSCDACHGSLDLQIAGGARLEGCDERSMKLTHATLGHVLESDGFE